MDAFAYLFGQLSRARGLNYSVASDLYHLVLGAGFSEVNLEIHRPAILRGENRYFLKWSVEEAGPALVHEGIISADALAGTLAALEEVAEDPKFLILAPRMSLVWAHKAEG